MHESPICWNMWMTLLAEPPETRMAKQSRKFPAYAFVPGNILAMYCDCLPYESMLRILFTIIPVEFPY